MTQYISPYKLGAKYGFPMGLLMIATFFSTIFQLRYPMLSFAWLILIIAIPCFAFATLRRTYCRREGFSTFSELWMQGIVTFLGGAIISSVVALAYFRYINPDLIYNMLVTVEQSYRALHRPDATLIADDLRALIDNNAIPGASSIVMAMFWLMVACGSLTSMLLSLLARIKKPKTVNSSSF